MEDNNSVRLNKYISDSGLCSRREADRFIEQGVVFINGTKAKVGKRVFPGDRVMVNGQMIDAMEAPEDILIAFNKPVGIVSTTEAGVRNNIVNYINYGQRIFPVGRLDKDSQGLIFLTNNGDIVNKILRAGNHHEKEYVVTVDKPLTDAFTEAMGQGVSIMGVMTKKCTVVKESTFKFRIILIQGLNRQIRRMCEQFGYEVTKLERIRIMNIKLKGLPPGEFRTLSKEERMIIDDMIKDSVVTEDASKKKSTVKKANKRPDKHADRDVFEKHPPKKKNPAVKQTNKPRSANTRSSPGRSSAKGARKSATGNGRSRSNKRPKR